MTMAGLRSGRSCPLPSRRCGPRAAGLPCGRGWPRPWWSSSGEDLFQVLDEGFPGRRVEGGEGLVEKEDLRRDGERPRKARPLGLPPGKVFAERSRRCEMPNRSSVLHDAPGPPLLYAADPQPGGHVVEDRRVEEQRLLEDHGEPPPVRQTRCSAAHRSPRKRISPAEGFDQAGQGLQQGRLSRAVGADQGEDLSLDDLPAREYRAAGFPRGSPAGLRLQNGVFAHRGRSLCWMWVRTRLMT